MRFRWRVLSVLVVLFFLLQSVALPLRVIFNVDSDIVTAINFARGAVSESGERKRQAISANFESALRTITSFVRDTDTDVALLQALSIRDALGASNIGRQLANRVQELLRADLVGLETELINYALVVTIDGTILASAAAPSQTVQEEGDISQAPIFIAAQNTAQQNNRTQQIVVLEDETGITIQVIHVILSADNAPIGFLIADLNLNTLIYNNLASTDINRDIYSFLVLPQSSTFLALPEVINAGRISINTEAVNRAINRQASDTISYTVERFGADQRLLGHYANIVVQDLVFSLITELDESLVVAQSQAVSNQSFVPLAIVNTLVAFIIMIFLWWWIITPLQRMRRAMKDTIQGAFDTPLLTTRRSDEFGDAARSLVDLRRQFANLLQDMERRLQARNRDLRVTQDISQAATAQRDLQTLMNTAVNLITASFPTIYHAQIFLIDAEGKDAVLRASTGEAGRQLLQRGHRLAVGSVSVIGQVTEQGELLLARDTAVSDIHRRNEFLPDTRAELAIPLFSGDTLTGALDVQSKEPDGFPPDLVEALQILANQISIAIDNVRLYEETQRLLNNLKLEQQTATAQAWQNYLQSERQKALQSQAGYTTPYDFQPLREQAYAQKQIAIGTSTAHKTIPFVIPIQLRNEVIGVVEYEVPEASFQPDTVLLAEELVARLSVSLDNARLFQASRRATEREAMVNQISAKITGQTDIEAILQTAILEVQQALRTSQVAIHFQSQTPTVNGHSS